MSSNPFRVIIVGGGPVGLSAAHVLDAVKIDFVLLEKRETTLQRPGAVNIINPFSSRILDQLGLYGEFEKHGFVVDKKVNILPDGSSPQSAPFGFLESLGYPLLAIDRKDVLEILSQRFPETDPRIKVNSKVVDVKIFDDGVEAILEDGSTISGSIVLGTDGTWSRTRALVQRLSAAASATPTEHQEEVNSTMQSLYGRAKLDPLEDVPKGTFFDVHTSGRLTQCLMRPDGYVFFNLNKQLPTPVAGLKRYSQAETKSFAEEFADYKVLGASGPRFGEIWKHAGWHFMVDQEQGFAAYSHHKRIVLAGDSSVKVTSVAGLGLNCGIQAVVNLANALRDVLDRNPSPSTEILEEAFKLYEAQTAPLAAFTSDMTKRLAALGMWQTWTYWFVDQWVMPYYAPFSMARRIQQQYEERMPTWNRLVKGVDSSHLRSGSLAWPNL